MRNLLSAVTTLLLVTLLAACNRSIVNLDYTNAKDEVQPLGNLVFRFDKSLVPDSLLNRWDSTEYISFSPKIPGRFRWESPDQLVFSPSQPLPPATSFNASLQSDLLQFSKFGKIGKSDVKFATPSLKLDNTNVTWVLADERSTNAVPQVDLYFNYPVNPNTIKDKLKLTLGGQPVNFNIITLSSDSKVSLKLQGVKMEDKDLEVSATIDKGLVPEGGTNGTAAAIENKLFVPSPFNLTINDVSAEHDGAGGIVYVRTSQQVQLANISTYIKFNPAVKFTVAQTDDGFSISSDQFDADKSYELTLTKGMRGRIGGTLREEFNGNVAFGELEPSIGFANKKGMYLSLKGAQNIEVKITNVPKVKVIISKIYESNILVAQRYGYSPKTSSGYSDDEYYYSDYTNDLTLGDIIYEKEIETRSLPKYGNSRLFNMNIEDRLPELKGIYHIMIRSETDYWVRDSRLISKSDLGLIAKEGAGKILVFANSIQTAQALNGVNVVAYGNNNQVLGTGATNAEGVAEIALTRKEFAGFKPAMIIAKTAEDFNFLPFNSTSVNTSRFEVGGKRSNSTGLDAFIYPERDIYRPGEKVNFSVIIRDKLWKSPGELPVKLKFLMPNGKEMKSFRKSLNAQGSLEGDIDIATSAITGNYVLEVYTSNDVLLGSKTFNIEEFVPDRIKVSTKLDKPTLAPGETGTLEINAVNFFGPPAANRKYESEIQVKSVYYNPKKYPRYNFSLENIGVSLDKAVKDGTTDANGNASVSYSVPSEFANAGQLQATFYSTVFDETGRPVSRATTANIFTQNQFFGIGGDGYWYYPLNQSVKFPLIALDKNENVLSGAKANVTVIKREYRTVLTKDGSYFRYQSQRDDKIMIQQQVSVTGEQTSFSYVPRSPGTYELRVGIPGATAYVSKEFYSYGYWGGDNTSFEVDQEGNIDIALDKTSYKSGESAKVLFKTPFSGRMLVTMETDHVVSHQYVNVENRTASVDLKLTSEHLPNVYVTATLIKPHDVSDMPLTVAHGFQSIRVEEDSRKIPVKIEAPQSVRSRTHQKITVKAAPGSFVTLSAVDNGVLQVSDFKTPDPYNYFYAQRALEVNAFDMYPLLLPELRARLSSTGGDGALDMAKRTNPMPAKRVKIVSYWSGILQANGSGEATFEFDLPQFSGEVRLMAVAYKNESFGSGETNMKVADPIVLSTALPRFLSPRDTVNVPVIITNTTAKSTSATATLSVSGPLQVVGEKTQTVSLGANSENKALFQVVAAPSVNVGKVKVDVSGLGEKFSDETEISVRPASPLQFVTGSGSIQNAGVQRINIPLNDFMPGSTDYQLVINRSPALDLGKQFRYLIQYPYGCTEQTISAAFPQLYYSDLAEQMQKKNSIQSSNANYNVLEALRKIKLRQLYSGAVTLWDGEGTENWWTSVYAAHFLIEAQKAGFEVNKNTLNGVLAFINNKLKNRETIEYYYNQKEKKKIAPKEVAYTLYVLALAGKANVPVMNYYKANPQLLSLDSKYLLSVAYGLAGDKARFKEVLPGSFSGEVSVAQTGGSFYSDIRDEAIALSALIDADPGNQQIGTMAGHVASLMKQRSWYSTQECAFSFIALGKMAKAANKATVVAEVKVNGKTVGKTNENGAIKLTAAQLTGTNVEIVTKGEGRLYYFWQSEGISVSGSYKEEDNFIRVRRSFFDRYGRAITGNTFKQNDLVVVKITLDKSYAGSIENIAVSDLLPAGFEIENPRTKEIPGMDWIKDASTPTSLDVRDDRINLFVDLYSSRQTYYYAVRAVSPGVFQMGPVSADAMYNGEFHSYNGAGTIRIVQ
ncbi:alpha-2-macroglobulin family protein [Pseudoflavitalea sp. G-6-1-2]|uniref:alpha-2-macroglobulin family protein n=1 Tax=Pseudoflavitalea sp. G-6-1-2 TaxID=2728841 RepID=UPI00146CFA21|nr:MG2 domain-containing protein [Pseudoflavitalea sp. G-6-1-2]NML22798.1 alpha-2-macroglobulin family protein [Pseudoflavitalea sp. G-6-1-2]